MMQRPQSSPLSNWSILTLTVGSTLLGGDGRPWQAQTPVRPGEKVAWKGLFLVSNSGQRGPDEQSNAYVAGETPSPSGQPAQQQADKPLAADVDRHDTCMSLPDI